MGRGLNGTTGRSACQLVLVQESSRVTSGCKGVEMVASEALGGGGRRRADKTIAVQLLVCHRSQIMTCYPGQFGLS
jgi:hypothetical protein